MVYLGHVGLDHGLGSRGTSTRTLHPWVLGSRGTSTRTLHPWVLGSRGTSTRTLHPWVLGSRTCITWDLGRAGLLLGIGWLASTVGS
jgi:hypothetical protein